jgi:hypothetical protein
MFHALRQLQEIYNPILPTKATKITIERPLFENIATVFQQAFEQIKAVKASTSMFFPESRSILNTLQQIEANIIDLKTTQQINHISTATPTKAYAEAIKTPITAA